MISRIRTIDIKNLYFFFLSDKPQLKILPQFGFDSRINFILDFMTIWSYPLQNLQTSASFATSLQISFVEYRIQSGSI